MKMPVAGVSTCGHVAGWATFPSQLLPADPDAQPVYGCFPASDMVQCHQRRCRKLRAKGNESLPKLHIPPWQSTTTSSSAREPWTRPPPAVLWKYAQRAGGRPESTRGGDRWVASLTCSSAAHPCHNLSEFTVAMSITAAEAATRKTNPVLAVVFTIWKCIYPGHEHWEASKPFMVTLGPCVSHASAIRDDKTVRVL
jgi:hypothetical protein